MSLKAGAKTRVRVNVELKKELEAKVGMHQGLVLSPSEFTVVSELARYGVLSEFLYVDDFVLMSERDSIINSSNGTRLLRGKC